MAKILIVEDDADTADALQAWLKREKHVVDLVSDGAAGLERMIHFEYDAIVLDWNLPSLEGPEICKRYRALHRTAAIIMLTGRDQIDDIEAGLGAGADDYLKKPFHPRELSARIKANLRRPADVFVGDKLEIGGLHLDDNASTITGPTGTAPLVPRERAILMLLMRHPNSFYTSDQIMNSVASSDSESSPDAVRVHIARLRQKLTSVGCADYIQSSLGLGYKIVAPQD